MIPPSFRKTPSRQGSVSSSRHGSVSSQGAPIGGVDLDPSAGMPQSKNSFCFIVQKKINFKNISDSFEDKRKENFDKGQAELDRRRKLLDDQHKKEIVRFLKIINYRL